MVETREKSHAVRRRITSLEALRALAFFSVFLCHVQPPVLSNFPHFTLLGVSVFFSLSGFLLMRHYGGTSFHLSFRECLDFSLRRIGKLYPLHILTMLAFALLILLSRYLSGGEALKLLAEMVLNASLLQDWVPDSSINVSLNGVAWYLSAAMFLYFLFPCLAGFISRAGRGKLVAVSLGILLLQVLSCLVVGRFFGVDSSLYLWFSYCFPVFRIGDLFVGAVLARFCLEPWEGSATLRGTLQEILWVFVTALAFYVLSRETDSLLLQAVRNWTTCYVLLAAGWVAIFFRRRGLFTQMLDNRLMTYLGGLSAYAFLIHYVVIHYLVFLAGKVGLVPEGGAHPWLIAAELVLSLALSELWRRLCRNWETPGWLDGSANKLRLAFLGLALACLLLPVTRLDKSEISLAENRRLAPAPHLLIGGVPNESFGRQFEDWLGDRFRFRKKLSSLHVWLERHLGVEETKEAFIGREGWLFYRGNDSERLYTRELHFSGKEKEAIMKLLAERRERLAQRGIPYFVFVPPDKSGVYGEYYRSDLLRRQEPDRIEDLVHYLEEQQAPQRLRYLLPDLLPHKEEGLLYYKTDTHWNELGAYQGYLAMMEEMGLEVPAGLQPEAVAREPYESARGDLFRMLSLHDEVPPYLASYLQPVPRGGWHFTYLTAPLEDHVNEIGVEQKEWLNKGLHTERSGRPYRVLVFMDSFGLGLAPYLAETFGEVMFVWNHDMESEENRRLVETFRPDIVIEEVVARIAYDLLPRKKG